LLIHDTSWLIDVLSNVNYLSLESTADHLFQSTNSGSFSDTDYHLKRELVELIQSGEWSGVRSVASKLGSKSMSNNKLSNLVRQRHAEIDKLVEKGDWEGVIKVARG
jgi:hypothetical protein